MKRDHWMSRPLTLTLSPLGSRVRQGEGIAREHFNDPLFRTAAHRRPMSFMTLPAPALAHGLSSLAATFILSFLALALVAPTLTDFFAIKRWLFKDRARLAAAILTNLAAAAVAIPLFLALQRLGSAAAMVLESGPVRAAYWLRTLSPWPEGLVTIAAMSVRSRNPLLAFRRTAFAADNRTSISVSARRHVRGGSHRDVSCLCDYGVTGTFSSGSSPLGGDITRRSPALA